jgi:uncharacterized protein (DUF362 family)
MSSKYSRREFIKLAGVAMAGAGMGGVIMPWMKRVQQPKVGVSIYKAENYSQELGDIIRRGLQNYPDVLKRVKDGVVVLKPNIVDHYQSHPVNTDPAVVIAAISAFRHFGAKEVIVAEGPGHRRDTEMLIEQSGFDKVLIDERVRFVDLNIDAISAVPTVSKYTGLNEFYFPQTVLNADLLVSMPKLKTHHWAGVTLSLKNMFGIIPGVRYGWPKNFLHWYGISESITDINTAIAPGFAIIDGIEGMDGDGPLHGEGVNSRVLIMGDNLTAVDATAARLMGMVPENIDYLRYMMPYDGTINAGRIAQLGEPIQAVQQDFRVGEHMAFIKTPLRLTKRLLLAGW